MFRTEGFLVAELTERISTHTGVGVGEILLDLGQSRDLLKEKLQKSEIK
jgi:hypothetical protein